jgi:hypothetical protein
MTILTCGCTPKDHKTVKDHTLNGNIKTVKTYQASAIIKNNTVSEVDKKLFVEYFYNNTGVLVREKRLSGSDSVYTYKYNSKGQKYITNISDSNSKFHYRTVYFYDKNDRVISEKNYRDYFFYDGKVKIVYDNKNNVLSIIVYDKKNKFNNRVSFSYDQKNQVCSSTSQSCYDAYPLISQYQRTDDGRIVEIVTRQNNALYSKTVYTDWDEYKNPTRYIDYVFDVNGHQIASTINYYEYEYY